MCVVLFSSDDQLQQVNTEVVQQSRRFLQLIDRYISIKYPDGKVQFGSIEVCLFVLKQWETALLNVLNSLDLCELEPLLQEMYS